MVEFYYYFVFKMKFVVAVKFLLEADVKVEIYFFIVNKYFDVILCDGGKSLLQSP